ncbi:MAG: TonB-dependent receptor [Sphingomonadales bacterium BRH_c3]|nr:MAG: TonB-dependent receptor [Sphingomonadales bacterium BRH_c3]
MKSRRIKFFNLMAGAATLAIAALPVSAYAQSTDAAGGESADTAGNEIIIIGTAGGKGINKLDASFSVTTFNQEDLAILSPKSSADLLKGVPGIWSESSGGVAGANIMVRGIPSGGDAPFVTFSVNGSPLFGTNTLSFFETSTLFRPDLTVSNVEVLRGGPNAVFARGEPGATINFRLKEGTDVTEGAVEASITDFGGTRFDTVLSGPLGNDFYYMVGGYVRRSDGVRDAQFTSEEGQQLTVQLTKHFDNGKLNLYGRYTDDHGQWYLPFNLANPNLDLGEFSQLGNATRLRTLQVDPSGTTETFDFADGRGWDGYVVGANAEFEIADGLTLRDNFNYVNGNADTFGFVPAGSAVTVGAVESVIGGPVETTGGVTLASDDFVQTYGHWVVLKDIESFSNDLSLTQVLGDRDQHELTLGVYTSSFSSDDWWSIGNPIAVHNAPNGDTLANVTPGDIATAGGNGGFNFGLADAGDADILAFYAGGTFELVEGLKLDGGVRFENIDINFVLDTGPGFPDGVRDLTFSESDDEIAWTAALSYDLTPDLMVYGRYSDGYRFPDFDQIRDGSTAVQSIKQAETGAKFNNGTVGLFVTGFYTKTDQFSNTVGGSVPASFFTAEAYGVEVESTLRFGGFGLAGTLTYQDADITRSTITADIGNQVQRQPEFQARFSPSYDFDLGSLSGTLYGSLTHAGKRFGDNANTVILPSYQKLDLGVLVRHESGLYGQVHADNLNDSHGITEGDPRNPTAPNGRPILGRSIKFTVGYNF